MLDTFVQIQNLSKVFVRGGPPQISEIQANFPKGMIVGLVGPDGAGKTTLLRLMAGLLTPTEGSISIGGYDTIRDSEKVHAIIGYMPQRFGLYEDLTVLENLQLYAELKGLPKKEQGQVFEKCLQFTGLSSFTKRLARDLSGGMKQKLGLACALLKDEELLLLDEPSVGVDPLSRRELWAMVQQLLNENILIIWSTSYLEEAEKCHVVLLLNEGKLQFLGKPSDLTQTMKGRVFKIEKPPNKRAYLHTLLEKGDVLDGVIQGEDIRVLLYRSRSGLVNLDSLRQSKIDSEASDRRGRGPSGQGEEEDRFDEVKPSPNSLNLTVSGIYQNNLKVAWKATKPRFEDAFIDLLHKNETASPKTPYVMPEITNSVQFPVVADHLTKRFGQFVAVNNISFQVRRGEVFGLLGPNGAGKSTTFKMLCGLLQPTEGKAFVGGVDLGKTPAQARTHIGYMAQRFSLYGDLTVQQNLEFFAGVYNLLGAVKQAAIHRMVEIFSLQPYLHKSCNTLPLGMKQKLSFAAAIMHEPVVLFLDEPTSGMDPVSRREFWLQANSLAESGCTLMVSTHFMDEAENCDRIALIYRGEIIHLDTPDALKEVARSKSNPNPTLEDAFVKMIEQS